MVAQLAEFIGYYRARTANVVGALLSVATCEEDMPGLRAAVEAGDTIRQRDEAGAMRATPGGCPAQSTGSEGIGRNQWQPSK